MNKLKYTFAIFALIILTVVVVRGNKNSAVPTGEDIDLSPSVKAEQLCYIWNTEAGDKAMLSMDIRGEKVIGEFYFLPAQKDSKTGIFKGDVISLSSDPNKRAVNAFWEAKAEGMTTQEELWIVFSDTLATPGFGEMKDRGDGVYVYADPEHIDYSLNLQQTDCGDEAMD